MANELVRYSGGELLRNVSNPMDAVKELGRMFAGSGMFGLKTPEQGAIFAMTCLMEGKTPMEIMRTYHIIQGRPSMRADAMQAEFLRAGGRIRWDVSSDEVCTITLTHPEFAPDGVQVTEEFKKYEAGGVTKGKDTWKIYRRRMLQCRAISAGIRQVMPQIVAGIYTPEEMADELEREQPATVIPPQAKTESEPQRQALPPAAANQASTNDLTLYRNKAIGEYKLIGVNRDRLEEKHGKADGWGKEKLRELRRIADALKAGETTIDAEFPVGPGQASPEEIARVSAALAPYGVIQQDMEFFVKLPASNWTRDKISQLDWAAQEIVSAQDPMYRAKELFELDPGAQG